MHGVNDDVELHTVAALVQLLALFTTNFVCNHCFRYNLP